MGTYGLRCQKGLIKFEMELTLYENTDFIYIVRFKRISGTEDAQFREITNKILQ